VSGMVVVLGGAGFLGSHLVDALVAAGRTVRVFDRVPAPAPNLARVLDRVEYMTGDFADPEARNAALADADLVFHLVSTTIPATSHDNPGFDMESNLLPGAHAFEHLAREGRARVVFVSSGGTVYGHPRRLPIPEDHAARPVVPYGVVKLALERYLESFHETHGLSYAVVRLSNPFGPRQDPSGAQGAATAFLHRTLRGEPLHIWGDGSVVRDYIHVDDAVRGILAAATRGGDHGVYNIGSGKGTTLLGLVDVIRRVTGREPEIRFEPRRPFDLAENVLDITLARTQLQWEPRLGLMEGLARTWEDLRNGDDPQNGDDPRNGDDLQPGEFS